MTPSISIIIPTYNYAHLLPRALASVFSQEKQPVDVCVVDDGSTDNTAEVIAEWRAKHPTLHYFLQPNQGPGAARNFGAQQAQGGWLLFLDADDELLPHALSLLNATMRAHPGCDAVLANDQHQFASGKIKASFQKTLTPNRIQNCKNLLLKKKYSRSTSGRMLIKKSVFLTVPYSDNIRHGEDVALMALLLANYRCVQMDKPTVTIHKHLASLRHQSIHTNNEISLQVSNIFDAPLFPPLLQPYRRHYLAKRLATLAKAQFHSNNKSTARKTFLMALRTNPALLLNAGTWKRLLQIFFVF